MKINLQLLLLLLSCLLSLIDGLRILGLFPFEGKSHFIMGEALLKALAGKGHDVVVVSHFPQKEKIANYTDRSLVGSRKQIVNNFSMDYINKHLGYFTFYDFVWRIIGTELCEQSFEHPVIQDLLHNDEHFDLLITEPWGTDCFIGFAHKFKAPHVELSTLANLPWLTSYYGNPFNPAYITPVFTSFKMSHMTFFQRVLNSLYVVALHIGHHFMAEVPGTEIARKYFGPDLPPLREIAHNSTVLLVNSHFSVNYPVPLVPGVVEVAGLHIEPPKPLPEDLKKTLDDSTNGVIVFALGSLIQVDSFDQQKIDGLISAFRKLPETVVFKFDGHIDDMPKNVKVVKWLPQSDVLAHPNVKLFVTHGGLMGTQESILAGVPMVGIPFFCDQRHNLNNYIDQGIAVRLNFNDITEENFLSAVRKVLDNPSYSERSKFYSTIFKDRPQSAMDTAIYWTEYVARYNGAAHLKPTVTKLYWFQALLLDVVLFLVMFVLLVYYAFKKIVRLLATLMSGEKSTRKVKTH